ncbi:hypothetical protein [Rhizobium sp. BR 314]|uniref:hypothetical protein n=1 Tax=Rhizobium sp. BR 314 TaxID=3040013 RepID=UPI0039BFF194
MAIGARLRSYHLPLECDEGYRVNEQHGGNQPRELRVDFRFELSRISILILIRPAFGSGLKRLINSTQFSIIVERQG